MTAAYLARAGLQTLVLERRPVLGGACVTEEPWPGYKVSTLAYLCSLFQPRIVRELQLERFGYVLYPKDPAFFTAFPDGRHLFFWRDQDRTVAALQPFSARDAALYPHYEAQLARLGAFVETLLLQTPPNIAPPSHGSARSGAPWPAPAAVTRWGPGRVPQIADAERAAVPRRALRV